MLFKFTCDYNVIVDAKIREKVGSAIRDLNKSVTFCKKECNALNTKALQTMYIR